MIPFTNELGLRDYRADVASCVSARARRRSWGIGLTVLLGLGWLLTLLGGLR